MSMDSIMVHFHPDERVFVDRAMDWVNHAAENHEVRLTDFLDPRQAYILQTLVNRNPDVHMRLDGGSVNAERCRAIVAPDYVYLDGEEMDMQVLSIHSRDQKFAALEHSDYMGAVLGLGIKRDKIGDIHVSEEGCHVVVTADIAPFLDTHLRQVHRVPVMTELLPVEELRAMSTSFQMLNLSVASMRLDGIASDVFRLSRTKIVQPIKAGRCRVNWKNEEDPSTILRAGDIVSLKGFGRFKVIEIEGVTKKGRMRVSVGIYA
ncbi:RNA-binding protein [Paenibacillus sp. 1001270B_150601_E10]|uniref:YlmH family RNA-binding protein n=1 Tax=Paenibacillus sp. 1001270B_150601_E10 TaxID=2787079 RepID=UPI00189E8547|nr:YlmH/Sll1252 family protein [Paenibacillus sp. 1001270B_150601_E10]